MRSQFLLAAAFAAMSIATAPLNAAVSPSGSGVTALFGSQSGSYQASDPAGPPPSFTPGPGLYAPGSPLPTLPAPAPVYPFPPVGNPFQGSPWTSTFNDLSGTTATSNITDNVNPTPVLTSDVSIAIPSWSLAQTSTAISYAWDQLNFDAQYQVNNSLAASTPLNLPLYINGFVTPVVGYAQFDASITYTWYTLNLITGVVNSTTTLGTLTYQWQQLGGGAFSQTLLSSGSLLGSPNNQGFLELSGYAWVAGDPFTINISSVPEPSSLGLLAAGALALLRRRATRSSSTPPARAS